MQRQDSSFKSHMTPSDFLPDGITLITKEDIYCQGVLLLKAGMQVAEDLLPKLINYGVTPSQFILKNSKSSKEVTPILQSKKSTSMTGLKRERSRSTPVSPEKTAPEGSSTVTSPEFSKSTLNIRRYWRFIKDKILVADTNDKDLKRLNDCLYSAGVPRYIVYPVVFKHLFEHALQKENPTILIADLGIWDSVSEGLEELEALKNSMELKLIIVTANKKTSTGLSNRLDLKKAVTQKGFYLLEKAVSRFSIASILEEYISKEGWNSEGVATDTEELDTIKYAE